jgi:hypothetical protein
MSDIPQEGHAMTCRQQSSDQIVPKLNSAEIFISTQRNKMHELCCSKLQIPARMCEKTAHIRQSSSFIRLRL